jgi:hypothetical protein
MSDYSTRYADAFLTSCRADFLHFDRINGPTLTMSVKSMNIYMGAGKTAYGTFHPVELINIPNKNVHSLVAQHYALHREIILITHHWNVYRLCYDYLEFSGTITSQTEAGLCKYLETLYAGSS